MGTTGDGVLPRRVIGTYALGSMGTGGFATLPGLVLIYYLTDTLGIAALWAGLLLALAKIWDVLIDPVMPIDRKSGHGRAMSMNRLIWTSVYWERVSFFINPPVCMGQA